METLAMHAGRSYTFLEFLRWTRPASPILL